MLFGLGLPQVLGVCYDSATVDAGEGLHCAILVMEGDSSRSDADMVQRDEHRLGIEFFQPQRRCGHILQIAVADVGVVMFHAAVDAAFDAVADATFVTEFD